MNDITFRMGTVSLRLIPVLKDSLRAFFGPHGIDGVEFTAMGVGPGGKRGKIVTHMPGAQRSSRSTGVPVRVWTEGTQAVRGLITAKGMDDSDLEKVVIGGLAPKPQKVVEQKVSPVNIAVCSVVQEAAPVDLHSVVVTPSESRNAIDKKLITGGLPQHDLELLRAFYLELTEKHFGGVKNGNVFVCNTDISALMGEAFGLRKIRGEYGNVYASRIRPFAESLIEGDVRGWNFSVEKILPFIEGVRLIPKIAASHPHVLHVPPPVSNGHGEVYPEIHEGEKAEPLPLDDQPVRVVTGEVIEQMIEQELLSDFDLVNEVALLFRARSDALVLLVSAQEEDEKSLLAVKALEEQLKVKQAEHAAANAAVEEAKAKIGQFQITDVVRQKVRDAKARIDALSKMIEEV